MKIEDHNLDIWVVNIMDASRETVSSLHIIAFSAEIASKEALAIASRNKLWGELYIESINRISNVDLIVCDSKNKSE